MPIHSLWRYTLKIGIFNTLPSGGGAHLAAKRLYNVLSASDQNISFHTLEMDNWRHKLIFLLNIFFDRMLKMLFFRKNPIYHSTNFFTVKHDLNSFDVLNVHWFSNGLISINALLAYRGRLVLTIHDSWLACGCEHHPLDGKFSNTLLDKALLVQKQKLVRKADAIIFPSRWQMKIFESRFGNSSKYHVIPNVCGQEFTKIDETTAFEANPNKKTVGIVANKIFQNKSKGSEQYIEFFNQLSDLDDPMKIFIAGKYDLKDLEFSKKYNNLNIIFLGALSETEMFSFYSAVDFIIHLSLFENLSNVLVETRFHGKPAVALNVGGNAEILLPDNDLLLQTVEKKTSENELIEFLQGNTTCSHVIKTFYTDKFCSELVKKSYLRVLKGVSF